MRTRKGFTIVELVIVIAVIAILAAVLIPSFSGIVEKTEKNTALKLAEAAYKEAKAAAKADGFITEGETVEADGFKFRFGADATSAEVVLYPNSFEYILAISGDKITSPGKRSEFQQPVEPGDNIAVTSVTMYRDAITLEKNQTEILHVSIAPANATNKDVTWESNNPSVATVNNGLVTAVGVGTAVVTATTQDGNFTATCNVKVNAVSVNYVSLNSLNLSFTLGDVGRQLSATVKPDNAANKDIVWESKNELVAKYENGTVVPVGPGYTEITATSINNITAKCGITVNGLKLEERITVVEGGEFTIPYVAYPAGTVTWSVVDGTIAEYNTNTGRFTALKDGTTKVKAEINGFIEECIISVTDNDITDTPITGITLDKTSAFVKVGETLTLTATAPADSTIEWALENGIGKIVSKNGVECEIEGVTTGLVEITATMTTGEGEPKIATCSVTVYESAAEPSYTVSINPESVSIIDGGTITLINEEITPPEGTTVEWASSNNDVATVESGGVVTAKKPGTAIISVVVKQGDTVVAVDSCVVTVTYIPVNVAFDSNYVWFNGAITAIKDNTYTATIKSITGYRIREINAAIGETTVATSYNSETGEFVINLTNEALARATDFAGIYFILSAVKRIAALVCLQQGHHFSCLGGS